MTIHAATTGDLPQVSELLAESFQNDPVSTWLFPDARRRREVQPAFLGVFAALALESGGMVSWRTDGLAATVWLPSGDDEDTPDRFGMLADDETARFGHLATLMAENSPDRGDHMHLQLIAVHPTSQRLGAGGELLTHDLAILDDSGTHAYLEASSWLSPPLYKRHGFEFTGKPFGPEPRTRMYPMWRDARQPDTPPFR
nr:GNAT family N-acetyltransferase [Kibdelosporangium sp. MJ126-NF4]CEL16995.1 GCN5-related N-acetyltransferase [Kibdelosporangium sp. MJ126-NF4]CTQ91776.1 GCN5-related N-acetyltransferase [Kibdelosporangium sp. MJ126-NF4]